MAKYSKKSKKRGSKSRRRRGMTGFSAGSAKSLLMPILGGVGGLLAAQLVKNKLMAGKFIDPATGKKTMMGQAAPILFGAGLAWLGRKSPLVTSIGVGIAASGTYDIIKDKLPAGFAGIGTSDVLMIAENITIGDPNDSAEGFTIGEIMNNTESYED